ncbi:MAG: hypothetical protein NZM12_01485 [Steroidobacteraceae bacterium]|nr:hypothetical protein [Steroidobacteraceae bacterium]MDW8259363.1 VapE family protein [Gammaproteobacteria bacterium]
MAVDFRLLAQHLLARADVLLFQWLPGGRIRGNEYVCGNLAGEPGDSLKVNLRTGRWADFATNERGGDLVSLFAAIHKCSQLEAARRLNGIAQVQPSGEQKPRRTIDQPPERPPEDAPDLPQHYRHGAPSAVYDYRDARGLIMRIARYESADGKEFAPWRWIAGRWHAKAWPTPRPLYRLDELAARPDDDVLVVEGEKAADAAAMLLPQYVVTTWQGGAKAVDRADWSPLAKRRVIIWPDADQPGIDASKRIAEALEALGASVSVLDVGDRHDGWDAADAAREGWDSERATEWISRCIERRIEPQANAAHPAQEAAAAIAGEIVTPSPSWSDEQIWNYYGLPRRGQGEPPPNEACALIALRTRAAEFYYDEFLRVPFTTWGGISPTRIQPQHFTLVLTWLQLDVRLTKMTYYTARRACELLYFERRVNCAQEWLRSLKWDGVQRLELLLPLAYNTDDDEYHRAVGKNFFLSMVKRVLEPGCQADYVMVLEGRQGVRKSTSLQIIGGDWYAAISEPIGSKDWKQALRGKMLIELAELASLTGRKEIERVKAELTTRVDTYRKSYAEDSNDFPRTCVFVGTTNDDGWNRDETGARRFWRVRVGEILTDWIAEHREQLFAEAVARVQSGESHYAIPEDVARRLQDEAMPTDAWHDHVARYIAGRQFVRLQEVFTDALQIPLERINDESMRRVRRILKLEKWVSATEWRDGVGIRGWRPQRVD